VSVGGVLDVLNAVFSGHIGAEMPLPGVAW
jgi:hypothetical protein